MLFKKKIVFTEGMNETLCSFDEIPWFSCCGVPYDKPSYYPYLQEKDPKRAEKLLLHTKNYSGTVCLTNLFKEGICRADTFILQTAGWKFYQNEFMPCVEASWRTYEKRALKAYPYHYIRLIVTGISDTKKALVFLKQHFGDSSFQQTKDRLKELPLLIYSGLDTGTAPLENSLDRWGLMYEKQQISLEKFLEDQAYIRNL